MRRFLPVLGPATLVLALGGCHTPETQVRPGTAAPSKPVYCTIMADPIEVDEGRRNILAPGRFRCQNPGPESIALTVVLERRDANGNWAPVKSETFGASAGETTGDLDNDQRTRYTVAPCSAGTFRTAVTATVVSRKVSKQHAMRTGTTVDPCTRLSARRR